MWGSGKPKREFIYIEDFIESIFYINKKNIKKDIINVGTGKDISIKDLAFLIKEIVGFNGELVFNTEKPDGTPRKLMDVSKMKKMGWEYSTELQQGIEKTYAWFLENIENIKEVKL